MKTSTTVFTVQILLAQKFQLIQPGVSSLLDKGPCNSARAFLLVRALSLPQRQYALVSLVSETEIIGVRCQMKAALPYVVSRVRRTSLSAFINAWGVAPKHFCFDGTKLVTVGCEELSAIGL